ncbi:MAG TPA: sugar phosphate isomerase/epimerase family protein [Terriglobia bacterium]|nr:sugar phosphate isomerase/epimerase family protein [Terriglobia bacterium]
MRKSSRRDFLKTSVSAACAASLRGPAGEALNATAAAAGIPAAPEAPPNPLRIKKGVLLGMLPKNLSYADRLKMARDVGFEGIQAYTTPDQREAEEIKKAADDAGIKIDSVMNMAHWKYPLSSADPAVVEKSMEGMKTSLRNAKFWESYSVLLVPAVVNEETSYRDAWTRSQQQIRKLIPMAKELGVVIALEEVWNKFLLSPLEFATYIDEFKSPWIKAWFDVGNVVLYGYPQDWIRTLGKRIVEVHLKDFKREGNKWVNLGEGSINWPEVRKAFAEIGYSGYATTELDGGDEAYLRDVSQRVDRLVLGV